MKNGKQNKMDTMLWFFEVQVFIHSSRVLKNFRETYDILPQAYTQKINSWFIDGNASLCLIIKYLKKIK